MQKGGVPFTDPFLFTLTLTSTYTPRHMLSTNNLVKSILKESKKSGLILPRLVLTQVKSSRVRLPRVLVQLSPVAPMEHAFGKTGSTAYTEIWAAGEPDRLILPFARPERDECCTHRKTRNPHISFF